MAWAQQTEASAMPPSVVARQNCYVPRQTLWRNFCLRVATSALLDQKSNGYISPTPPGVCHSTLRSSTSIACHIASCRQQAFDDMAGHLQTAVEQTVLRVAKQLEDQLDSQLHKLDNLQDDDLESIRQRRIRDLKQQQERTKEWVAKGHGEYTEITEEKEFFKQMKGEERMVCHFYRDNWPCKVIDKHLSILCKQHLETKFVKINAEKAPYLTDKLKIWMLPTLALIKSEKVIDYVVGFDDFGGTDDFSTDVLAERLERVGVIRLDSAATATKPPPRRTIRSGICHIDPDDEDSDFGDD